MKFFTSSSISSTNNGTNRILIISFVLALVSSSSSSWNFLTLANAQTTTTDECKPITTVPDFDIAQYASLPWYSHQQAENSYSPITQNYCVKAEYTVRTRPSFLFGYTVDVSNRALDITNMQVQKGDLCAYQTDLDSVPPLGSKLAVAPCFLPKALSGPYWIVAYDEGMGYALISGGQPKLLSYDDTTGEFIGCTTGAGINNSGLWIFSRSPYRDQDLISYVRNLAVDMGFDVSVLNDVDQSPETCGYPALTLAPAPVPTTMAPTTMAPTVSDIPTVAASSVPSHTATVSYAPSVMPTPLLEDEGDVSCVDTVGDFPNWTGFGSARDCDYVEESWTRIKCLVYADDCPETCGTCDE